MERKSRNEKLAEVWAEQSTLEIRRNRARLLRERRRAEQLLQAHLRELKRAGVSMVNINLGWVVDEDGYMSKTDKGYCETLRLGYRRYEHRWSQPEDYDYFRGAKK